LEAVGSGDSEAKRANVGRMRCALALRGVITSRCGKRVLDMKPQLDFCVGGGATVPTMATSMQALHALVVVFGVAIAGFDASVERRVASSESAAASCNPCEPGFLRSNGCGNLIVLIPLQGATKAMCLPDYANANCIPVVNPPCYASWGVAVNVPAGGSVQVPGSPPPAGPCADAPRGGGWVKLPFISTDPAGKPPVDRSGCGDSMSITIGIYPNACGAPNAAPVCTEAIVVGCTLCSGVVGPV